MPFLMRRRRCWWRWPRIWHGTGSWISAAASAAAAARTTIDLVTAAATHHFLGQPTSPLSWNRADHYSLHSPNQILTQFSRPLPKSGC